MIILIHILAFIAIISVFVLAYHIKQMYKLSTKQHEQATQNNSRDIKSPSCVTSDGIHAINTLEEDPIFYAQCEHCFERFVLITETVVHEMKITIIPKEIPNEDKGELE